MFEHYHEDSMELWPQRDSPIPAWYDAWKYPLNTASQVVIDRFPEDYPCKTWEATGNSGSRMPRKLQVIMPQSLDRDKYW